MRDRLSSDLADRLESMKVALQSVRCAVLKSIAAGASAPLSEG
jgi:hypothetical protein